MTQSGLQAQSVASVLVDLGRHPRTGREAVLVEGARCPRFGARRPADCPVESHVGLAWAFWMVSPIKKSGEF
jgi:hypothetical protein